MRHYDYLSRLTGEKTVPMRPTVRPAGHKLYGARSTFLVFFASAMLYAAPFAHAQTPPESQPNSPGLSPPGMPPIPPVMENKRLDGDALVAALRKGGFVLYLRHAETGEVTEDCSTSNVTAKGREQAKLVGQAMRSLKIPFGSILSSEVCRALETAKLLEVGPVVTHDDLFRMPKRPDHLHGDGRTKLLATMPATGNTLLVGHVHSGNKPEQRLFLNILETVVFRPGAEGPPDVVARIRQEDWPKLLAASVNTTEKNLKVPGGAPNRGDGPLNPETVPKR